MVNKLLKKMFNKPIQHILKGLSCRFHCTFIIIVVSHRPSVCNPGKNLHRTSNLQGKEKNKERKLNVGKIIVKDDWPDFIYKTHLSKHVKL